MSIRPIAALAVAVALLSGCANRTNYSPFPTIKPEVRANLEGPVDCSRAQQDIRTLEEERASVGKQLLSGVRAVLPIAAVAGLLMGDYSDRVAVATGHYNDDINAKIDQIKLYCRIP